VSVDGVSMDPTKVQTILDVQTPRSVREIHCFLGFAKFYRKFIKRYSEVVLPLIHLTQKNFFFTWTSRAKEAFLALKKASTSAPVLAHVNPTQSQIRRVP
jgi:hypothetical protein